MKAIKIPKDLDREAFAAKAKEIYARRFKRELEATEKGKVVAIAVESGEIFIGHTALEAGMKARQRFPEKIFYFIRVGYPAVHSQKGVGKRVSAGERGDVSAGVYKREP